MQSQMKKRNLTITQGEPGSYSGPRGIPQTAKDGSGKWNIQNMLRNVITWTPNYQENEERQQYAEKEEREDDIEQGKRQTKNKISMALILIAGGYIVWRAVR